MFTAPRSSRWPARWSRSEEESRQAARNLRLTALGRPWGRVLLNTAAQRNVSPSRSASMALFVDSSDPKEIKDLFAWGVLSGVTTNPLIISKEAPDADLGERIREIIAVSTGDVSVELTTETEAERIQESLQYHGGGPARITVKGPFSEQGRRAVHQLGKRGPT